MVRNILLRYSEKGDLVLDQMVGSGTTLVECKLLGRNGIGIDINKNCIMLTRDRLNFRYTTLDYDSEETVQKRGSINNIHTPYMNFSPFYPNKTYY